MNECQHECVHCGGLSTHVPGCEEPYRNLCMTCERAGYAMVQCSRCDEWKPSKRGLVCASCAKVRVVA